MTRADLKGLVKFNPAELKEAIEACNQVAADLERQRQEVMLLAMTYRQLLQLHGIPDANGPSTRPTEKDSIGHARFARMSIRDGAYSVLAEAGRSLHGSDILNRLAAGGLVVGGKHPMNALTATLHRDERVERDHSAANTWRAKRRSTGVQSELPAIS